MSKEALRLLAAKDLLDFVGPDAMPPEATRVLLEGIDSPSVRQLAGMDGADSDDVRATFRSVLRELDIEGDQSCAGSEQMVDHGRVVGARKRPLCSEAAVLEIAERLLVDLHDDKVFD